MSAWIAPAQDLGSLKAVSVPQPSDLSKYVRDPKMLVVLGKALFWDMQAGSDGRAACATCHFHAGADHRAQNQLVNPQDSFPVNHALGPQDFPFRVLSNPDDNRSGVLRDSSAVAGSAGLFRRIFGDIVSGSASEDGYDAADAPAFSVNGINARRVTARNSPSVINSVFYVRNFWDGRASNLFTGLTPFGDSDGRMNALAARGGGVAWESVRIENASLASQAVGPPMNDVEMSYQGRTWPKFGKKMLGLRPLALQRVSPDDSVLGSLANPADRGLLPQLTYLSLVQAAFQPEYWISEQGTGTDATQAESNFALFWGLAIQAYQATLVSDDARFDQFSEGAGGALSSEEQLGLRIFRTAGGCTGCHLGPEFTAASFSSIARRGAVQRLRNGLGRDTGFFRIGVRPIAEDAGLGGDDGFGRPLSLAAAENAGARSAAQGAFKTPTLRNVELTGPYFHNGGQATLGQVVDFYARGGDFPDGGNLGPGIRRRNLTPVERQALVAFLKSLSDDRVRFERAPFDHPELCVSIGHPEPLQADASDRRFPLSATDRWAAIPVVGAKGNSAPLQTFEELLAGIGADGSRTHTLTEACPIP
ncbi:MAG: cytochrome C peroxidase [Acidobacteria bacterium]|nr:cytochrome C peroxidase [Acidobacteriota bacterium]